MRNEASIEIDRPIDEVFRLTIEHVAEWSIKVFLFGWLMNKSHCDATDKELNSLKRFCEKQPV